MPRQRNDLGKPAGLPGGTGCRAITHAVRVTSRRGDPPTGKNVVPTDPTGGSPMSEDSPATMQQLTSDECYHLLATQQIGRLGVNAEHYPLIFPVNYALDSAGVIVVRTHPGTKLAAADHANVTFEVDEIDQRTRSGWSVLVRGLAEEVTSAHRAELVERTHASRAQPWAPGEHGRWLRVIPHAISGRRIVPGELPPPFEDASYP
jgi:nitroimidazol reductase NimA-like FMN-containing flavoprotein (pyridoxamine 5'-phosphate oxidase superfamily)